MDSKTTEALSIIYQVIDQVNMTGPQRRTVEAAYAHIKEKLTLQVTAGPAE